MRVLVVSDPHGDLFALRQALLCQPKAEVVIHLGDGYDEWQQVKSDFPEKAFYGVRGNNDWGCREVPLDDEIYLLKKHIVYTHGHTHYVKYGLYDLITDARSKKADVLLYGHTHVPDCRYEDGLYIVNPGSLHGSFGTFAILDITHQGVVPTILHLHG